MTSCTALWKVIRRSQAYIKPRPRIRLCHDRRVLTYLQIRQQLYNTADHPTVSCSRSFIVILSICANTLYIFCFLLIRNAIGRDNMRIIPPSYDGREVKSIQTTYEPRSRASHASGLGDYLECRRMLPGNDIIQVSIQDSRWKKRTTRHRPNMSLR